MILADMQQMQALKHVREGILKPDSTGNGWQVAIEDFEGIQYALTLNSGTRRLYHSLDSATRVLREIGVDRISVVERF